MDENYRSAREARQKFEDGQAARYLSVGEVLASVKPRMVEFGEGVVAATYSMAELQKAILGDDSIEAAIAEKRCLKSIGCGQALLKEDGSPVFNFDTREEAETYEMEWRRTGLCPTCLDGALDSLGGEDEDEGLTPYNGEHGYPPDDAPAF